MLRTASTPQLPTPPPQLDHRPACHERQGLEDYVASYADIAGDAIRNGIVDTDSDTTTQGQITDPEDRRAPVELSPWKDGGDILSDIYDCLLAADNAANFPPRLQPEETAYELATINCEAAVHLFDVDTMYKPAKRILDSALQRSASLRTAISLFLRRRRYNINSVLGDGNAGEEGDHELVFSPHCRAASITAHRGQKRKRSRSAAANASDSLGPEHPSPAAEDVIQVSIGVDSSTAAFPSVPRRRDAVKMAKTKSGPGDYYCSLVSKSSSQKPTLLVVGEAKAPHKLTRDLLQNALNGNDAINVRQLIQHNPWNQPDPDLHPRLFASRPATLSPEACQPREQQQQQEQEEEEEEEEHHKKDDQRWVAAVAAQLYTELLKRSMRYGYITTGESYVFVRIRPDQPAVLEYLLLPNVEPQPPDAANREKWLAATPLARLSCLVLLSLFGDGGLSTEDTEQAVATSLIWQSPRHRVDSLGPKSFASAGSGATNGSDTDWKAPDQSSSDHEHEQESPGLPRVQSHKRNCPGDEDPLDNHGPRKRLCHTGPSSPSPEVSSSPAAKMERERVGRTLPTCSCKEQQPRARQYPTPPPEQTGLQAVPFCTSRCILSLTSNGKLSADPTCANRVLHRKHPSPTASELIDFARASITLPDYHQSLDLNTEDTVPSVRRPTANAAYMGTYGAASFLFKVRVQPGDYVLVAKGARSIYPHTDADMIERLRRETRAYQRLRTLQGQSIPVCAGLVDISEDLPRQKYEHLSMLGTDWRCPAFLLLSWAGNGLSYHHARQDKVAEQAWLGQVRADIDNALRQVHELGVLQGDAAMRNFVVTLASEVQVDVDDPEGQGQPSQTGKPSSVFLVDFERSISQSRFAHHITRKLPPGQSIIKDRLATLFQQACKRERNDCLRQFDNWAAKRIRRLGL